MRGASIDAGLTLPGTLEAVGPMVGQEALVGRRQGVQRAPGVLWPCVALAVTAAALGACAGPTLVSKEQARVIETHERALAPHAEAIQQSIRQSGDPGGLVFLD